MSETKTYIGITQTAAADFYAKALASGFTLDGPTPIFIGLVNFAVVYKNKVEFFITYSPTISQATISIVRKDFPYNLVPDDTIFHQIDGYIDQVKAGTLAPNMSIWSNATFENHTQWGGFARPYFHRRKKHDPSGALHFSLSEVSFTVPQIAKCYNFPEGDAAGEKIGIVELGGGYKPEVLDKYLPGLAARTCALSVDGGQNSPGEAADGEVYLDIEVVGAIATKAEIVVAFAPNTEQGFADAIIALTEQCTRISISWGAREDNWTEAGMLVVSNAIQEAVVKGLDVTVAQGDNDYTDGGDGPGVDFPGSCPYALSCGGTALHVTAGKNTEMVWNNVDGSGTGGGISSIYPLPTHQQYLTVPIKDGRTVMPNRRIVPDVAGVADPATGYIILMPGGQEVFGGTSAVAPLWAALLALIGKRKSYLIPSIYSLRTAEARALCFNENITGDNGYYSTLAGQFSAAVGLGTPNGAAIKALLTGE